MFFDIYFVIHSVAAVATAKREPGSVKGVIFPVLYQTTLAWLASFLVYRIGVLFF